MKHIGNPTGKNKDGVYPNRDTPPNEKIKRSVRSGITFALEHPIDPEEKQKILSMYNGHRFAKL